MASTYVCHVSGTNGVVQRSVLELPPPEPGLYCSSAIFPFSVLMTMGKFCKRVAPYAFHWNTALVVSDCGIVSFDRQPMYQTSPSLAVSPFAPCASHRLLSAVFKNRHTGP